MLVMNMLDVALPCVKPKKYAELREKAELQLRKSIPLGAAINGARSLDPTEADKLRVFEGQTWLETAPKWNGTQFPFQPKGQPGSVYNLPARVANFLVEKYNRGASLVCETEGDNIIQIVTREECGDVEPLQPSLDDPLLWSSESFRVRIDGELRTISQGLAEPPEKRDPKASAIPTAAIMSNAKVAAAVASANVTKGEPQLRS